MSKVNIDIKTDRTYEENVVNMVPSGGKRGIFDAIIRVNHDGTHHEIKDFMIEPGTSEKLFNIMLNDGMPSVCVIQGERYMYNNREVLTRTCHIVNETCVTCDDLNDRASTAHVLITYMTKYYVYTVAIKHDDTIAFIKKRTIELGEETCEWGD